ncbi:MAG: helix-turn-helix domain-containing protein [Chloroflexota bacterium]
MVNKGFGSRLRELRKQAGLTQRELARQVNVDFTYLSKIENETLPPPSDKVIARLAEVLNTDRDELMLLAGRIPADVAQILKNREVLKMLRSSRVQKKAGVPARKPNARPNIFNGLKRLSKIAIPVALVLAIAASLWFTSPQPVKALDITITNPPTGTLATTYSFQVKVTIDAGEVVPITRMDMEIYNVADPTKKATCLDLPLIDGTSKAYTSTQTGGGAVSVLASAPNLEYFSGGTYAYAIWQGPGPGAYYFYPPPHIGGGYGYSAGVATAVTYSVSWTSPSTWPTGNYKIKTTINTSPSDTGVSSFSKESSLFALSAATTGGGAPAPAPQPGVTSVTTVTNTSGVFTSAATATSDDSKVKLDIAQGTTGLVNGTRLTELTILPTTSPPAPPADSTAVALTYELGPAGATFSPPITLTMTYDPALLPTGIDENNLVIAVWDGTKWVNLTSTVDTVNHTITTQVSHFSKYAVFAYTRPATFSVTNLNISPVEVNPNQSVTVSVVVTNTGDLSGSYSVTLKVNNVDIGTQSLTLAGGVSQTVTFTTTKAEGGNYTVSVGGLSGTFTVRAAAAPAAFTVSGLNISPSTIKVGDKVTITVNVSNTGDVSGIYTATLKINGTVISTQDVTLAGKASQPISFQQTQNAAGTYTVSVDGQSGTFTVQTPTTPTPPTPPGTNWLPIIIGIIAGVIVIAVVVVIIIRRRSSY